MHYVLVVDILKMWVGGIIASYLLLNYGLLELYLLLLRRKHFLLFIR